MKPHQLAEGVLGVLPGIAREQFQVGFTHVHMQDVAAGGNPTVNQRSFARELCVPAQLTVAVFVPNAMQLSPTNKFPLGVALNCGKTRAVSEVQRHDARTEPRLWSGTTLLKERAKAR
jgi:hypothetical protein